MSRCDVDNHGSGDRDQGRHVEMDEHGHDHADHKHGVGGHTHSVSADADGRYLTIALLLIVGFMALEVVVGIVAHSLALLSDAAHMLTDAGALALSLVVPRRSMCGALARCASSRLRTSALPPQSAPARCASSAGGPRHHGFAAISGSRGLQCRNLIAGRVVVCARW